MPWLARCTHHASRVFVRLSSDLDGGLEILSKADRTQSAVRNLVPENDRHMSGAPLE